MNLSDEDGDLIHVAGDEPYAETIKRLSPATPEWHAGVDDSIKLGTLIAIVWFSVVGAVLGYVWGPQAIDVAIWAYHKVDPPEIERSDVYTGDTFTCIGNECFSGQREFIGPDGGVIIFGSPEAGVVIKNFSAERNVRADRSNSNYFCVADDDCRHWSGPPDEFGYFNKHEKCTLDQYMADAIPPGGGSTQFTHDSKTVFWCRTPEVGI